MLTSNDLVDALQLEDVAQLVGKLCSAFYANRCHASRCAKPPVRSPRCQGGRSGLEWCGQVIQGRWWVEIILFLGQNGRIVSFFLLRIGHEDLLGPLALVIARAPPSLGTCDRSVDSVD